MPAAGCGIILRGGPCWLGGVPLAYRFTGQRWDGVIQLYDDHARYYDPAIGRFIQPDSIVPEPGEPQDLNRYTYVRNNPARYTDPSGHAICADEYCSVVFGPRQRNLIRRGPEAYYWDQNGLEMAWDWFTESGPQTRYYGASAPMTQDLMQDEGIQQARAHYYLTGEPRYHYRFSHLKQPLREAVQWVAGEDRTGVGSVLGSYTVYIQNNGDGTVTIWVKNVISRESGTRLLGYESSVEDTVVSGQVSEKIQALTAERQKLTSGQGTLQDVRKRLPVSILNSTVRGQSSATGLVPGVWGGDMEVWYMWTEPPCISCY